MGSTILFTTLGFLARKEVQNPLLILCPGSRRSTATRSLEIFCTITSLDNGIYWRKIQSHILPSSSFVKIGGLPRWYVVMVHVFLDGFSVHTVPYLGSRSQRHSFLIYTCFCSFQSCNKSWIFRLIYHVSWLYLIFWWGIFCLRNSGWRKIIGNHDPCFG